MTSKIEKVSAVTLTKKDFDFDYWKDLASKDPEAFESARKREIDQYISTLNSEAVQDRMRRLQWRIEMERKRSKNPVDSAARIYDMMWESVGKSVEATQNLVEYFKPEAERKAVKSPQAKILAFKQAEEEPA